MILRRPLVRVVVNSSSNKSINCNGRHASSLDSALGTYAKNQADSILSSLTNEGDINLPTFDNTATEEVEDMGKLFLQVEPKMSWSSIQNRAEVIYH